MAAGKPSPDKHTAAEWQKVLDHYRYIGSDLSSSVMVLWDKITPQEWARALQWLQDNPQVQREFRYGVDYGSADSMERAREAGLSRANPQAGTVGEYDNVIPSPQDFAAQDALAAKDSADHEAQRMQTYRQRTYEPGDFTDGKTSGGHEYPGGPRKVKKDDAAHDVTLRGIAQKLFERFHGVAAEDGPTSGRHNFVDLPKPDLDFPQTGYQQGERITPHTGSAPLNSIIDGVNKVMDKVDPMLTKAKPKGPAGIYDPEDPQHNQYSPPDGFFAQLWRQPEPTSRRGGKNIAK